MVIGIPSPEGKAEIIPIETTVWNEAIALERYVPDYVAVGLVYHVVEPVPGDACYVGEGYVGLAVGGAPVYLVGVGAAVEGAGNGSGSQFYFQNQVGKHDLRSSYSGRGILTKIASRN